MKFSAIVVAAFAAVTPASAAATPQSNCLTPQLAQTLAKNYGFMISQWPNNPTYAESLSKATLTDDYTDYSDSIKELVMHGCTSQPQPMTKGRAQFDANQLVVPPSPWQALNIWNTCDTVIVRWGSNQTPQVVKGIIVLETKPSPPGSNYTRIVYQSYSEANSAAWLINDGSLTPKNCSKTS